MLIPPSPTTTAISSRRLSQGPANTPDSSARIEITAGEENVSSGDRSNNSVNVSITTPAREASTIITREQATNQLETRFQNQAINNVASINTGVNQFALSALQNSNADSGGLENFLTVRNQQRLAQTYLNATPTNNTQASTITPTLNINNGANIYNQAADAYIQQTLFFSGVERVATNISTDA